ncbi:MAG: aspartate-semialdehyde dehydrogenase, partial [Longimicrobiales bacterium]
MRVAVLGATGAVGRTMLEILEARDFPAEELVPLASERSAGTEVRFRGRGWPVRAPTDDAFDGCALALFSAGAERSRDWAPRAAARGAVVVDNSSAWRMD